MSQLNAKHNESEDSYVVDHAKTFLQPEKKRYAVDVRARRDIFRPGSKFVESGKRGKSGEQNLLLFTMTKHLSLVHFHFGSH